MPRENAARKPGKKGGANLGRSLLRKKHNNFTASSRHTTIDDIDGMYSYLKILANKNGTI